MALSVNELLIAIDEMEIYKKDFDVIQSLLDSGDDEFFVKMLEEVINGHLYWSDFEHNLANTNYPTVLREQLKTQKELNDTIRKIILLRRTINPDYVYTNQGTSLGIVKQEPGNDTEEQRIQSFYESQMDTIRGNILYDLTTAKPDDTILETAFKTRIYNALRNGELVLKYNSDSNVTKTQNDFGDEIDVNGNKFTITDTEILIENPVYEEVLEPKNEEVWSYYEKNQSGDYYMTDDVRLEYEIDEGNTFVEGVTYYELTGGLFIKVTDATRDSTKEYYTMKKYYRMTQEKHEYINPNDIFLNVQNYIIPIHANYQVLDAFDIAYMKANNIKEDHMKQIKMISMEMRRDNFGRED